MNHNSHHLAGLPEWADQAEADAACEALGLTVPDVAQQPISAERSPWACVAAYYWVTAYAALCNRDWSGMWQNARKAAGAETSASLDGVQLRAIFGERSVPEQPAQMGAKLHTVAVSAARAAVRAEIVHHTGAE